MKKQLIIWCLVLGFLIIILLCLKTFVKPNHDNKDESSPTIEEQLPELEDGAFYILSDGKFSPLYIKTANYEVKENTQPSDDRTLWFRDDFSDIPTMYLGDKLVYKTTDTLDEEFVMERFEYVGYTVGLSNLTETLSGRFSFSPDIKELDINPDSDCYDISELTTDNVIIDRLGNADLRSGNISSGGCILGLEKDHTYLAEVYEGSIYHEYNLKADNIALTSMKVDTTVDYSFMQSEILEVHIPEYFNSGYYLINGFGLVRYVYGTSYDENTNFNIPNIAPSDDIQELQYDENGYICGTGSTMEIPVDIVLSDMINITFSYLDNNADDQELRDEPSVMLKSDEEFYKLYKDDDKENTLSRKVKLNEGHYTLEIENIYFRHFIYSIESDSDNDIDISFDFTHAEETEEELSLES